MDYLIRRGKEEFGPYSLLELQQYVQSGHILTDDLAKNEGMQDWEPVLQVLGTVPASVTHEPVRIEEHPPVKLPPNLHWLVLFLLVAVTQQYFNFIWVFVLANWARRLTGSNKPLVLVAMYPASFVAIFAGAMVAAVLGFGSSAVTAYSTILVIAGLIAYVVGVFSIKAAMEEYYNSTENIGLTLSGPMTFLFGSLYLQYNVNRLARWKKTGVLS